MKPHPAAGKRRKVADRSLLLAGILAVALVAGCVGAPRSGGPEASPSPTAQAPVAPPGSEVPVSAEPAPVPPADDGALFVFPIHGKLTAAARAPAAAYVSPTSAMDPRNFPFTVDPGAAWLWVDLFWSTSVFDLDVQIVPPGCDVATGQGPCLMLDEGAPGAGDSPIHLNITDPQLLGLTGTWYAIVWAKAAVNTSFDGAISVGYPPASAARPT